MKFEKSLLDTERYLSALTSAKNDIKSFYGMEAHEAHHLKTVLAHYLFSEELLKVYSNNKVYNNITITNLRPVQQSIIKTTYGYSNGYEPKSKDYDNDLGEGFFRVEYEFKTETETRKELFYYIATGETDYKVDYFLAKDEVRKEVIKLIKKAVKKSKKRTISHGIYTIKQIEEKYYYERKPVKEISNSPIITPAKDVLAEDVKFFFNNIDVFSCFNQTPNRKVLLAGPQGTGKSSLAFVTALAYEKQLPVVFTTDIGSAAFHLKTSAKKGLPTILVLEDADATFQYSQSEQGSYILNILDGVDMPRNKAGFYMIMTTNYPERIEDRIKKRPGRVDKIIMVGSLHDGYALHCATEYAKALMNEDNQPDGSLDEEYLDAFDGLTGAQIKDVITATRIYMAQNQVEKFSLELVLKVKSQIKDSLKSMDDLEKDLNANMTDKSGGFGFGAPSSSRSRAKFHPPDHPLNR